MSEYVFVYGTLKRGEHNNRLLQKAEYVCDAMVPGCVLVDLGGCPGMLIGSNGYDSRAKGEVFKFDNAVVLDILDNLEQEGSLYKRIMLPLYVEGKIRLCWTYILLHQINAPSVIKGGVWSASKWNERTLKC